jgi:hypothetical protein
VELAPNRIVSTTTYNGQFPGPKGMPHGFEVGYESFTINGRMLGSGEPLRVKKGERVLFHILNGSATEIRSLALPGHTFTGWGLPSASPPSLR